LADTKITDLTAKTTVVATDELVINDVAGCNVDKKIGLDDLKTYTSLCPTFIAPALGTPASGVATNITGLPLAGLVTTTASRALVSDACGVIAPATTTSAEIGHVNGVTSAIQTQMDLKAPLCSPTLVTPALGTPASGVLTNATGLPTAGLVDDAVTLGKMATGTDGNLISYDACTNPVAVATGTACQVLTSNGAGSAPTFQAAGGGGGFTVVHKACDQAICTDTTLTIDCCIQFCAEACSKYAWVLFLEYKSPATPDFKYNFSAPTNATGLKTSGGSFSLSASGNNATDAFCVAQAVTTSAGFTKTLGSSGKLTTTCAGVFGMQWAQNTSSACCTTLTTGTWMMFQKL